MPDRRQNLHAPYDLVKRDALWVWFGQTGAVLVNKRKLPSQSCTSSFRCRALTDHRRTFKTSSRIGCHLRTSRFRMPPVFSLRKLKGKRVGQSDMDIMG
jgi:hypothetical protein